MEVTKVYFKHSVFTKLKNKEGKQRYKYIIHTGSSRSSKTFSIIQWIDDYLENNPNIRATVWRDTRTSLGGTVWSDYKKIFGGKHIFGKQTNPIHYSNGSIFEPHGADFTNAHGLTQNIAWINEPYKITKETFDAIDQRADLIIIDWNPITGHWIEDLSKNPRAVVIHSTFNDNPFCPEEQRLKILSYDPSNPDNIINKTANKYNWDVYGLGVKSEKPNKIYHNWEETTLLEYESINADVDNPIDCMALDFGSSSPSGLVELKYKASTKTLYIKETWYKPIPHSASYGQNLIDHQVSKDCKIIADSAEPDEIRNINSWGFWCTGASKGKGSVNAGIKFLQTLNIKYVGANISMEVDNYEWEMDRYGIPTDKPRKGKDHLLDAIRYGAWWLKAYLGIQT